MQELQAAELLCAGAKKLRDFWVACSATQVRDFTLAIHAVVGSAYLRCMYPHLRWLSPSIDRKHETAQTRPWTGGGLRLC